MYNGVYSTLKQMEERGTVTIQDALNVFQDLCEDIRRQTENPVEKQPLGDLDSVVTGLCSTARTVAKIYRQNEPAFSKEQYQTRWEKANKKLEEAEKNIEKLRIEIEEQKEQKKAYEDSIREQREALSRRLELEREAYEASVRQQKKMQEELTLLKADTKERQDTLEELKKQTLYFSDEKLRLDQAIRQFKQEMEHKKEENERLQEKQKEMKKEVQCAEEKYRLTLSVQEKREELLTNLYQRLEKDNVLKNGWMGSEGAYETTRLYEAVEHQRMQVEKEMENFRNSYSLLVAFLEKGGF